jgi:hypothetical protein
MSWLVAAKMGDGKLAVEIVEDRRRIFYRVIAKVWSWLNKFTELLA